MSVQIYIEGQRLDLFEDENISITSNVSDVKDLKLKADFSQSFTVPATPTNNQIFSHWYDFNVTSGFDARTRKDASIDIDTLDFKRGKIRLNSAKVENGRPVHYNITFFGAAVKIKDLIGDDKLVDLPWLDNFDHDYTSANVHTGLTDGLDFTVGGTTYTDAIIYPLISYQRQWLFNSNASDTTSTDTLVNINYNAVRSDGIKWSNLKPAINVPIIFKAIEEKYGLTFDGSFFDTQRFKQIYMNVSNDVDLLENGILVLENVTGTYSGGGFLHDWILSTTVTPDAGFTNVPYRIRLTINGNVVHETPSSTPLYGTNTAQGILDVIDQDADYETKVEIITESAFDFSASTIFKIRKNLITFDTVYANNYTGQSISLTSQIASLMPDLKVYDFLLSFIKMFNLIVTTDSDNADVLYWQDKNSWYSEGAIYDITQYIDTKETEIKRGEIYSQINFNFEESDQILADEFRQTNKIGFGDIEQEIRDANNKLLDGGELDISVSFENPIFERLIDQDDNDYTPIQYCLMLDRDLNTYVGAPFLFYVSSLPYTSAWSLGFVDSTPTYSEITDAVFMPSHSQFINYASFNLNFNAEYSEYTGEVFEDTLYDRYYSDFINDVFSIQRRMVEVKGILPFSILHNLKLNDRLIINDTRYIINKITSNLVDRMDSFELINDIYDAPLASDQVNTSLFSPNSGVFPADAGTHNATYYGLSGKTVKLVTAETWITLNTTTTTSTVFEVDFDLDANDTGLQRTVQIQVVDALNNPTFTVIQESEDVGALDFSNPDNAVTMSTIINVKP